MQLAAKASVPFVSLSVLAIATSLAMGSPDETVPVGIDIVSSPEPIEVRARVYSTLEHHSVWEGTYVCAQGLSSMTLTIDVDAMGAAMVRYDFGPVPSNPVVPQGAFILRGALRRVDAGFLGELEPTEWIDHPDGYLMLPLSLETDDDLHLRGRIHHDSCHDFRATRML